MNLIKSLFLKNKALSKAQTFVLCVLMACAFSIGFTFSFLDTFLTAAFFKNGGGHHVSLTYIVIAFCMMAIGSKRLLLDRRHGSGAFLTVSLGFLITLSAVIGYFQQIPGTADLLFVLKYVFLGLCLTAFWSVSSRFLPLKIDSLKFVTVVCAFLGGIIFTGFVQSIFLFDIKTGLIAGLGSFIVFNGLFGYVIHLLPVPAEAFTHRGGGTVERKGRFLVAVLLWLSFFCTAARVSMDYTFYVTFFSPLFPMRLVDALILFWSGVGTAGFLILLFLYRTRYLYTTLGGMCVFVLSLILTAGGIFGNTKGILFTGYILFYLTFCCYVIGYFRLLPLILIAGQSRRIKTLRMRIFEPTGFLLGGLGLYFYAFPVEQGGLLIGYGIVILILVLLSTEIYSGILFDSFKMRLWRGPLLLIARPRLLKYVLTHLRDATADADETIYFLRVLAAARHPRYEQYLIKSLRHSQPAVRLFALDRMNEMLNKHDFCKLIEHVYEKDDSLKVKNKALSILIPLWITQEQINSSDFNKYTTRPETRIGALAGFLKAGGDYALLAIAGLQKWASSKKEENQMKALEVMSQAPVPGLMWMLSPFLKSRNTPLAKQALLVAGAMGHPAFLTDVFDALKDDILQENALDALKLYGKKAFPPIEKMLLSPQADPLVQKRLILFLGSLKSGEGKQILFRALKTRNQKMRKVILQTLINSDIVWIHTHRKKVLREILADDVARARFLINFMTHCQTAPMPQVTEALESLRRSLERDLARTREVILYQLALLKPDLLLLKAVRILTGDDKALYPAALSGLQDLLPHRLFSDILEIIAFDSAQFQAENINVLSSNALTSKLTALILTPPFLLDDWSRAMIFYCLRQLNDPAALSAVKVGLKDSSPYVLEAAIWALVRLESNKEQIHELLLDVPTSRLISQSLDEFLK